MTVSQKYLNRRQAGHRLSVLLKQYANNPDVLILALPRGGVPVGYEIARALHVPLDVFIVRKLGLPQHEECAIGALASGGTIVWNEEIRSSISVEQSAIDRVLQKEQEELRRREQLYRGNVPYPVLEDKMIILVDDGIATGATMQAAVLALKKYHPKVLIVAVPVAQKDTCATLAKLVDKLVCPLKPRDLYAVGMWYEAFEQTTDEEVIACLSHALDKLP